tara:strand:+ start:1675 stop:1845 length:171 start_codon:yes stop_codon:yes gene_type:complete
MTGSNYLIKELIFRPKMILEEVLKPEMAQIAGFERRSLNLPNNSCLIRAHFDNRMP